jgi:hypothetical protein
MQRSSTFISPGRQTLLEHPHAQLQEEHIAGPIKWLNPTRARFAVSPRKDRAEDTSHEPSSEKPNAQTLPSIPGAKIVQWRARDNRKGMRKS